MTGRKTMRLVGVAAVMPAGLSAGVLPTSGDAAPVQTTNQSPPATQPVNLTPDRTTETVAFEYERTPKPLTVGFRSSEAIDDKRVLEVDATDLIAPSGDRLPADQLTWTRIPRVGGSVVRFKVVVDPKGAKEETYTTTFTIVGDQVTSVPVRLTATFKERGFPGYAAALGLVLAAALFGRFVKFVSEVGTKLRRTRKRLQELRQYVGRYPISALPADYAASLAQIDNLIESQLLEDADTALASLAAKRDEVVAVARWLIAVDELIRRQEVLIDQLPAAWHAPLHQVTTGARAGASKAKDDSWPEPSTTQAQRDAISRISGFTLFIEKFRSATEDERTQPPLSTALVLYQSGQYEQANTAWMPPAISAVENGGITGGDESRSRSARLTAWIIDHSPLILAIVAALVVAGVAGLTLEPTFHGRDWLQLAAAGFAAGLTGATIADLLPRTS